MFTEITSGYFAAVAKQYTRYSSLNALDLITNLEAIDNVVSFERYIYIKTIHRIAANLRKISVE